MKVAVFDIHLFEKKIFEDLNSTFSHELTYFEARLVEETVELTSGFNVVCCFTNDHLNAFVLDRMKANGVKLVALRSAGFNHVDLKAAARLEIKIVRVPAYSPYAVAEHAVMLMLSLNRKTCRASARVRELNFSLDGLVGFDMHRKTVGIIGSGRIGSVMAKIMTGFGCNVIVFDQVPNQEISKKLGLRNVSLAELYELSDIITLHVPLTQETRHLINSEAIRKMKKGVMIINTGRGALIDAKDLISALKSGHIGAAGLDVYEEEENIFFRDFSDGILQDDILARLMTFPNVLITAHQAFLTREALHNIVETTLQNIQDFDQQLFLQNEVKL